MKLHINNVIVVNRVDISNLLIICELFIFFVYRYLKN